MQTLVTTANRTGRHEIYRFDKSNVFPELLACAIDDLYEHLEEVGAKFNGDAETIVGKCECGGYLLNLGYRDLKVECSVCESKRPATDVEMWRGEKQGDFLRGLMERNSEQRTHEYREFCNDMDAYLARL